MFDVLVDFFNHMPLQLIENTHVKFKVFHFRFYEVYLEIYAMINNIRDTKRLYTKT